MLSPTTKQKIREIQITTESGQIEELIKYIRKNMFQMSEAFQIKNTKTSNDNDETLNKENSMENASSENLSLEYELTTHRSESKTNNQYGLEMNESLENFCCEDETIKNRSYDTKIMRQEKNAGPSKLESTTSDEVVDSLTLLNLPKILSGTNLNSDKKLDYLEEITEETDLSELAEALK